MFVEEFAEYLDAARALAAMGGPYCSLDFSEHYGMEIPHVAHIRDMGRLLRLEAILEAREGNWKQVTANIIAQLQFAQALREEPITYSQMTAGRLEEYAIATFAEIGPAGTLNATEVERLINALDTSNAREQFAAAIITEAQMAMRFLDEVRSGDAYWGLSGLEMPWGARLWYRLPLGDFHQAAPGRLMSNLDESTFLDLTATVGTLANKPYWEASSAVREMEEEVSQLPAYKPLSRRAIEVLLQRLEQQARYEAEAELMRLGLSL